MSIELKLKANLKRYAGGSETLRVDIESGLDLLAIMEDLGVPINEIMFFCLNGKRVGGDYVPRHGDSVEVIPAITGG